VRELNIKDFPNELLLVQFNFKEACEQVGEQILDKDTEENERIEKEELPKFADLLWSHIFEFQKILTHQEFKVEYFKKNNKEISEKKFNEEEYEGLLGRIYRSYGACVRDCLMSLQFQENLSQFGVDVRFNRTLDIEEGIDILLLHKGKKYGLNLYLDSPRSRGFKKYKDGDRHEHFDDVIIVNLPCPFGGRIVVGKDIWMYGIKDRNIVREALGLPIIEQGDGWVNDIL